MKINTKIKKTIIIVVCFITLTMVVVILLISPIAKYLIEKYDEKYTGRQIDLGWIYVNPFTGYIHISDLKIHESKNLPDSMKGDSIFFSAKGVSADFVLLKLLSKTIEISEITLDHPMGIIIQNGKALNFSDEIKFFTPKKARTSPSKVHFNISGIKIIDGEFHYREVVTPFNYYIKDVNIESTGKHWDSDTLALKYSFVSGPSNGIAKGNFTINFKTIDYRLSLVAHQYDLTFIEQYLKSMTNYGYFSANFDADIKTSGNFTDGENINATGMLAINDFHFGKNPKEDFASFEKLVLAIIEISPKDHKYLFDSVSLNQPYFKYERYDYLDNLQRMVGKNGANIAAAAESEKFNLVIEIARYVKVLAKNFFHSDYKVNRLGIYNGDLKFNDFAISEKFSVELNPLTFIADSVDKNHKRVNASLTSGIKPYGNALVTLSINPNDSVDFDIRYRFQKIPVTIFNPYLITYTSYPLDRGTLEINGTWMVREANIQSENHLVILDPRRTRRVRNKDKKWLPLPLIMSLVRERGNVIDYQIPITGNLKNPKFHLHDVLMDLLENIFVKPATAHYRLEVKNIESEIEQTHMLKWEMRQNSLSPSQENFIKKMVDFLEKNPETSIEVYPMHYAEKEKEYIGFFEAKKKYFLLTNPVQSKSFSEDDSERVDKMSAKDSLFDRYLNKHLHDSLLFTVQEKCVAFVGSAIIDSKFTRLNNDREMAFIQEFEKGVVKNRVKMHAGENTIPYNGFSYFRIAYKGELPKALLRAYHKMNELNNEAPRDKYKKDRRNSR